MERCPACRARLGTAEICPRCGVDFSIARRAERQAGRLLRRALGELSQGRIEEAASSAHAATQLADPMLARVVSRMIERRKG